MNFNELTSLQAAIGAKVIRNKFAELQTRDNDSIAAALCEAFAAMQEVKPERFVIVTTAADPARGNVSYSDSSPELEGDATPLEAAVEMLCSAVWDKGFCIHHSTVVVLPEKREYRLALGTFDEAFDAVFEDINVPLDGEAKVPTDLRKMLQVARSKCDYPRVMRGLELEYEAGYSLIRKSRHFDNKEALNHGLALRAVAKSIVRRTGNEGFDNKLAIQYLQVAVALEEFFLSF